MSVFDILSTYPAREGNETVGELGRIIKHSLYDGNLYCGTYSCEYKEHWSNNAVINIGLVDHIRRKPNNIFSLGDNTVNKYR